MEELQQAIEFIKSIHREFTNQMHRPNVKLLLQHQDIVHLSTIMMALKQNEPAPTAIGTSSNK